MQIFEEVSTNQWHVPFENDTQLRALHSLENGKIILFPQLPFALLESEEKLLSPRYADTKAKVL